MFCCFENDIRTVNFKQNLEDTVALGMEYLNNNSDKALL